MLRSKMLLLGLGLVCLGVGLVRPARALLLVPGIFSNNMVLQQGRRIPVWGWTTPGRQVEVDLAGHKTTAVADLDGEWMVKLPAMKAGGPWKMFISADGTTLRFGNILIGEVWLCSGQSNLEFGMKMVRHAKQEIAAASHPNIRLLMVPRTSAFMPVGYVHAKWKLCTPQTIVQGGWGGFSGVAYFFARQLRQKLKVPIGVIDASWGGTRIQSWMPLQAFESSPMFAATARHMRSLLVQRRQLYATSLANLPQPLSTYRRAVLAGQPLPSPLPNIDGGFAGSAMFNGMIAPLIPYGIRGVIWYQGENNVGTGMIYARYMQAMIATWRKRWGEGTFPFYYVQIAPYFYSSDVTQEPLIWNAQLAALSAPKTGMVVTYDIARDTGNLHPRNKQAVARRLARWAFARTYGFKHVAYSGPLYKSLRIAGNTAWVSFYHVDGGLASSNKKPLSWFAIAGADGKLFPARAVIVGDAVKVFSAKVAHPTTVTLGWSQTARPNLINKAGLPASAFDSALLPGDTR